MGDMCEEVQTEGGKLFFNPYLLVQFEVAAPGTIEMPGDKSYHREVYQPGPPGVVPGVVDDDGEDIGLAPLVVFVE